MEQMRWDQERRCFVLSDGTISDDDSFALESTLDLSLSSIRKALARQAGVSIPPLTSMPTPEPYRTWEEFAESVLEGPNAEIFIDPSEPNSDPVYFILTREGHLRAHFAVRYPMVTDKETVVHISERVFGDLCILIQRLSYASAEEDGFPNWIFDMIVNPAGVTLGSFWQAYKTLCFALTSFPRDLVKSSEGVQLALRLGHPDVLIGTPESSWLEVKSYDYRRLSSSVEKIKLAQDVARFANANGGLLVLGLRTSSSKGVDTITKVTALPLPARSYSDYRKAIDAHVYPFIRGLEIFSTSCPDGELLSISIPSQSDDDKPFLVHGNLGEITDRRVRGQFVSIVQRRGDGAEFLSGPAIYGLIARKGRSSE
jgi:hypothetical protein